jgi:hypothetical protein
VRLAELIGCRVFDCDGTHVGSVHDVRFIADGPPSAGPGKPSYRLAALIFGSTAVGNRLGYVRRQMKGPWPLPLLASRLARRSYVVDWEDVTRFERPRIEVRRRGPRPVHHRRRRLGRPAMTDTNGLDILIAWSVFLALLVLLGAFVLRGRTDPLDEARRRSVGSRDDEQR